MPDDNVTTSNPASAATPSLPTVAPDAPTPSVDASAPNGPVSVPAPGAVKADVKTTSSAVVTPDIPGDTKKDVQKDMTSAEIPAEVARRIGEAHNVLIALSSDPSVDEMAAAIGLSLYLDRLGKRATAIYSGQTPNALEFLKPEETFEPTVDTLQDFVIALNKDKADHLRYKLDGDFVKIYITPYKSRISEEDLDFSYGDYNVDLVLALDVANGVDLDTALREHGRIMHDAVIIDITTGNPGKLGEIEWSDKSASSVSEMIARLLYSVNSKIKIEKEEATAFLTGIVAATNRFSNAGTTPGTMQIASKLMESGANQQLVSQNITPDVENEMFGMPGIDNGNVKMDSDPTKLDIEHGKEESADEDKEVGGAVTEKESTLLDDLKAAEESLAAAGAETVPDKTQEPLKIDSAEAGAPAEDAISEETAAPEKAEAESEPTVSESDAGVAPTAEPVVEPVVDAGPVAAVGSESVAEQPNIDGTAENSSGEGGGFVSDKPEKVLQPLGDFEAGLANGGEANKYGQMLEDALASADGSNVAAAPVVDTMSNTPTMPEVGVETASADNPAAMGAPVVTPNPEINGVPEINYMPMPGDEVLPPPPAPPIDMNAPVEPVVNATVSAESVAPESVATPVEPVAETMPAAQPVAQEQPVSDPGAFKIPGM